MITISSGNMDELKSIWKRLDGEYELVEKIHLDKDKLDYQMSVVKTSAFEISPVLKCVAEKVFDHDRILHDDSFFKTFNYSNFLERVEDEIAGARKYPGIARLTFIWKELTQMEKRMLYNYLNDLVSAHETQSIEC